MKKSVKITYQEKSVTELQKLLVDIQKKLVESKLQLSLGKIKDTSIFKKLKYEVTLIKTLINQKHNDTQSK